MVSGVKKVSNTIRFLMEKSYGAYLNRESLFPGINYRFFAAQPDNRYSINLIF
jgi:hypothetical protein